MQGKFGLDNKCYMNKTKNNASSTLVAKIVKVRTVLLNRDSDDVADADVHVVLSFRRATEPSYCGRALIKRLVDS